MSTALAGIAVLLVLFISKFVASATGKIGLAVLLIIIGAAIEQFFPVSQPNQQTITRGK